MKGGFLNMCSMKKCKGCGAPIQNKDPKMAGYSVNLEQDYCQRCFRLTHYGDLGLLKLKEVHNDEVYEISITPNRGDCMSLIGIARDLSVALNLERKPLESLKSTENAPGIGRVLQITAEKGQ